MKKYQHILTATDFSAVSKIAAQQAIDLAEHYEAELTFLHVVEHFPEHLPHYHMAREEMDTKTRILRSS